VSSTAEEVIISLSLKRLDRLLLFADATLPMLVVFEPGLVGVGESLLAAIATNLFLLSEALSD
jgi:hypothetical protein